MNRQDKADRIGEILDGLYPAPPVPLDHQDPYTLLVSVMLSAQTTDKKVNEVTPALFAEASDPSSMAALPVDRILSFIRTVGLAPTKAKNLKAMAELLLERHGGEVPDDIDALEALPGVGHKTASVVMCQAFGRPAFPVDTHIHRLAARWGLSDGKNVVRDRGRPQEAVPRGHLDSPPPADHLLRARALPRARSRLEPMRDLWVGGHKEANI